VKLTITDSGVGMSEEVRTRIFEPFFTTKGVRGTGLGLSMVHGIVNRHQGQLQVTSTVGEGTTVTICLPMAGSEVQREQPRLAPPSLTRSRLRVLVIDDEPILAQTLGDLLHGMGHEATVVLNGAEGLRRMATEHFDLILTDLGMPEMSGWEVATAVKVRTPSCPVILVTGWGESLRSEELVGTGVDLVLNKPYTLVTLQQILVQGRALIGRTEAAISDVPSMRPTE
jgi:CheY-like chemotaxis protein